MRELVRILQRTNAKARKTRFNLETTQFVHEAHVNAFSEVILTSVFVSIDKVLAIKRSRAVVCTLVDCGIETTDKPTSRMVDSS